MPYKRVVSNDQSQLDQIDQAAADALAAKSYTTGDGRSVTRPSLSEIDRHRENVESRVIRKGGQAIFAPVEFGSD